MIITKPEVYDAYWKVAALRQEVFFKRLRNLPPPWSDDEILNIYKFCNVYRASDRVSQFLIKEVIYQESFSEEDTIFRIIFFKIFNKIETWQRLQQKIGQITLASFNFEVYSNLLQEINDSIPIYTNAYMSCANKAYGFSRKHQNHLMLLINMFKVDGIPCKIIKSKSLEDVFKLLKEYPLIGDFMAYQLATDLNYSNVINFSENSFTMAGPGAVRGIRKCFESTGGKSPDYLIRWTQENQEREFDRLGIKFQSLWGRHLHLIDCQSLFCEIDKYSRVAFPELKSNRKRIKARFTPNRYRIEYFYPPKWGINEAVRADLEKQLAGKPVIEPSILQLPLIF